MKALPIFIVIALYGSLPSVACTVTPPSQVVPAKELVARTPSIVLAVVTKAEHAPGSSEVVYHFTARKVLKGPAPETIRIPGAVAEGGEDFKTFGNHEEERFWEDNAGRCVHDTDCRIHPTFAVGQTYLLFLGAASHRKGYELIQRTDEKHRDRWLGWVEKQVETGK